MGTAATPDAADVLARRYGTRWVETFRYRGRVYTMVPGGPSSFYADRATFRVWPDGGRARDLTVRRDAPVDVLTVRATGELYGRPL